MRTRAKLALVGAGAAFAALFVGGGPCLAVRGGVRGRRRPPRSLSGQARLDPLRPAAG